MQVVDGWVTSEGTVVASAVLDESFLAGLRMAGRVTGTGTAVVGRPRGVVLGRRAPVELAILRGDGTVGRVRRLGRPGIVLVVRSSSVVALAPGSLAAAGIVAGDPLEFRAAS